MTLSGEFNHCIASKSVLYEHFFIVPLQVNVNKLVWDGLFIFFISNNYYFCIFGKETL